jgi:hypothetical protein
MPQVDIDDYPALLTWALWQSISYSDETRDPHTLKAHQRVNWQRVATMPDEIYKRPILISADGFILDGNHRAAAHRQRGEPVSCIVLGVPFFHALGVLYSFAGTTEGQAA